MKDFERLYEYVLTGDADQAREITERAIAKGVEPQSLVNDYMIPAMDEIGRRFEARECFVPELLVSARAMKAALELIRPLLAEGDSRPIGQIVIGTVKGDLHDMGKNLVAAMLEGGGFEVIDLGVDVLPDRVVAAVQKRGASIVGLSALLTTTMPAMKAVIEALSATGIRDRVKVMIGGAPVTQRFADEIGADGYSDNAAGAVKLARKLLASFNSH